MSTEPSRKREGDKSNDDPPSKVPVADPSVTPHDVVLIVKGQKFYCLKEKLAENSTYFEKMFFAEFSEKDKEEVEIGEVAPDVFQLFIDSVNGINSITDEYSEVALVAAMFLESTSFEDRILKHFAENSEVSLKEQFKMAEEHKSHKFMVQVCASIKIAHQLDEVIPKNLDSFCNTTKNIVLQRSFELLGIRKPPSPPLPEEPDQLFEHMMNQLIDQVEIQNHHGEVLEDQVELLFDHMIIDRYANDTGIIIGGRITYDDPLIKELTDQLKDVHEQHERNFIQAQIQVLKWKDLYARVQSRESVLDETRRASVTLTIQDRLTLFSTLLNSDERYQSRPQKVTAGTREIDQIYRNMTTLMMEAPRERPRNLSEFAGWLQIINNRNNRIGRFLNIVPGLVPRPRPDNLRVVSNRASFRLIDEFVTNARNFYYATKPGNEPNPDRAGNMAREPGALNP